MMKRVGILRGGMGNNYTSSLQKGGDIILHILENLNHKYKTADILVDKGGIWHINGRLIKPADLIHKVDVIWNTAQPNLSITLNNLSIPNIGINSFSSILKNSREMFREHINSVGVLMPKHIILPVYQKDFDGPRERYAIKKAKENAKLIAKAGGFGIGRLLSIEESGSPDPIYRYEIGGGIAMKSAESFASPTIEAGSQEIIVNVNLRYEIE